MITNNIIYAAGILFYSKSIDQTPYFLLGKDFENRWSNFGGRCELSDKYDSEVTAAREAWEETLGAVYDYENMRSLIKNKTVKCITSRTPSGHPYYMFVVKIPFTTSYRDRFTSTKKFISNIPVDKKFLEINDIKWVSLNTIKYSIENKKSFIKLRTVFEQNLVTSMDEIVSFID
jgi:8-oxo-dGTP pyrophosphatase MutT (NUDIX family)